MSEEKIAKRGWVKNAAIIFLAVMLVLTFFSNTILNRSLPEVAVGNVQSGSITTRIRGTGTVEAQERYEVKLEQSRTVDSVKVRTGDTVAAGDVLFLLSDKDSAELESAQNDLDKAILAYRIALINAAGSDYAKDNRDIEKLQVALSDAQATVAANYVDAAALSAAKASAKEAAAQVEEYTTELAKYSSTVVEDNVLREARDKRDAAATALAAAEITYGENSDLFEDAAKKFQKMDTEHNYDLEAYQEALVLIYKAEADGTVPPAETEGAATGASSASAITRPAYLDELDGGAAGADRAARAEAFEIISSLENDVYNTETAYEDLLASDTSSEYAKISKKLAAATETKEIADEKLAELSEKQTAYETAKETAASAQTALDDALFNLQQTQTAENKETTITTLNLAEQKKELDKMQETVNKLKADAVGQTVTAPVAGTITSISVSAGNKTDPETALAVIEVPDLGYKLSFAVTREQAAKVRVGDDAEVSNYYWGNEIKVKLAAIKNDPNNPGQGRLLEFSLEGGVESGASLTVSVGQRSANYDLIVPNSALRSDSKGDFVLQVVSKSTPLGNRYTVKRADVTILAQDDTNTAVSGGLVAWDYVVTTSTRPIEANQRVRLAE